MSARYSPAIDFSGVDAIDFHTHVEIDGAGRCAYDDELAEATGRYFKLGGDYFARVDDLAEHYRQRNTAAVVFTIDAHTVSGHQPNSVEELIEGTVRNNDVLIPFGSVDPWDADAVRRVGELTGDYGVRGFKFHPSLQGFEPNDRARPGLGDLRFDDHRHPFPHRHGDQADVVPPGADRFTRLRHEQRARDQPVWVGELTPPGC